MGDFRIGDTIRCKDAFDAGEIVEALSNENYDWEYMYEYDENNNKQILVKITGRVL